MLSVEFSEKASLVMLMMIAMEITPIIIISNKCVEINVILNNLQSSL